MVGKAILKFISRVAPKRLKKINYKLFITRVLITHLLRDYGWANTIKTGKCVNKNGDPIPWYTYPAIDFLSQLDYSDKEVFEYGCGYSTLYWGARAKSVVSVEGDEKWVEKMQTMVPANCNLVYSIVDIDEYSGKINSYPKFDVIVIDGHVRTRMACCEKSIHRLNPGGIIILDNSDRCPNSAAVLRNAGFIQCDFTGFAPLGPHAETTSIFFSRDYNFQPLNQLQPHRSVAQPNKPYRGM